MARYHDARRTYEGTARFVDAALRRDDSLFTPGRAIWSLQLLDELDRRFIQQPDLRSEVGFEDKLRGQLDGRSADVYQLMGEILVPLLPAGSLDDHWAEEARRASTKSSAGHLAPSRFRPNSTPYSTMASLRAARRSPTRKPGSSLSSSATSEAWKQARPEMSGTRHSPIPGRSSASSQTIPVEQEGAYYARESLFTWCTPTRSSASSRARRSRRPRSP